jgi:hypothetical protein
MAAKDPEAVGEFFGSWFMLGFIGKYLEQYVSNPADWVSPMIYEPAIVDE